MNTILERISKIGIVPVVRIDDLTDAAPLAKALCDGGLPVAEVTFRTDLAKAAMIEMKKQCPDMLLGAGTVLTTAQVDDAIEAGAEFIVSPGINPVVVQYCIDKNIPVVPGCANPSDIELALSFGLTTVKFFPAELLGGLKMIKALAGPYVNVTFMPTGGIKESNICEYLAYDKILACGGTWMVDSKLLAAKQYDKIADLTRSAVNTMLGLQLAHIGINATPQSDGEIAGKFAKMLNCEIISGPVSSWAGSSIEVMKNGRGTNGHICYSCNNVERAIRYFESQGYKFNEETKQFDSKGKCTFVYFAQEIGGFAIHLKQR